MERLVYSEFANWKEKKDRKPLILRGARQVGKTYLMRAYGKTLFEQVHYYNFEKQPQLNTIFEQDLDPIRIKTELEIISGTKIQQNKSLIIFDEIQQSPKALNSLKYFAEELPEQHICAAGSLLGLVFSEDSFPVGMTEYLDMNPMTFEEFLIALGEKQLNEYVNSTLNLNNNSSGKNININLNEIIHNKIWNYLKWYLVTGGLPEVIKIFIENYKTDLNKAFKLVRKKQKALILNYYADIAKHCGKINASHIESVLSSIPRQLAKNQDDSVSRYKFKDVIKGLNRYNQLSGPIDWLQKAGLIIKVPIIDNIHVPLSSQVSGSIFKLYLFDVGLLGSLSELSFEFLLQENFGTYKGYIAENFVANQLQSSYCQTLYCWSSNTSEVEFICEKNGKIIPIEVKSGQITKSKSLKVFLEKYSHVKKAIILSGQPLKIGEARTIDYFPLYCVNKVL